MYRAKEVVINEQSGLKQQQQQQQTDLDLSVKQHHKHIQNNKDKKENERKQHTIIVYLVRSKMTYYGGKSSFSIHYDKSDTKMLQEISLKAHKD